MRALILACAILAAMPAVATELIDPLQPLASYAGKTWRGQFTGPDETEMVDVMHWEIILGGAALRGVHSLNGGAYGGETLIYWHAEAEAIAFVYVTTAGFRTEGVVTPTADGFTSVEYVSGDADGITEVHSTSRILPDGGMEMVSKMLKNEEWVPGHSIVYEEAPEAVVTFE